MIVLPTYEPYQDQKTSMSYPSDDPASRGGAAKASTSDIEKRSGTEAAQQRHSTDDATLKSISRDQKTRRIDILVESFDPESSREAMNLNQSGGIDPQRR
ncbi:unnamed protein product [Zymoseptoria tritici ST99CH_3D1]|nr:unnamed protein product [Zymoseptoria tritici ST99CH_3D1]